MVVAFFKTTDREILYAFCAAILSKAYCKTCDVRI